MFPNKIWIDFLHNFGVMCNIPVPSYLFIWSEKGSVKLRKILFYMSFVIRVFLCRFPKSYIRYVKVNCVHDIKITLGSSMSLLLNKICGNFKKKITFYLKKNSFVYTNAAYNESYVVVKNGYLEVSNIHSFYGIFSFLSFEKNIFSFFY